MFNVLDLFAGIGGFSLGLERTGHYRTAAFCEQDLKCQEVLRKHWPDVPIFDDVRTLTKDQLSERIDIITGGFPCQDISLAGKGAGLEGERSGLWFQFHRLIEEVQPQVAIIENVSALRSRGLDRVLGSLSEIGYDAEWHCIPAAAVGAPHRRDRVWIVAHPSSIGRSEERQDSGRCCEGSSSEGLIRSGPLLGCETLADPSSLGSSGQGKPFEPKYPTPIVDGQAVESFYGRVSGLWGAEPNVGRVAHGVPSRVDRLKQLGNAVVPQIPELLGEAILPILRN